MKRSCKTCAEGTWKKAPNRFLGVLDCEHWRLINRFRLVHMSERRMRQIGASCPHWKSNEKGDDFDEVRVSRQTVQKARGYW